MAPPLIKQKKLSAIPASQNLPAASDTVVAVDAAGTDKRFTVEQVAEGITPLLPPLSDIPVSGSPPALDDTLVGVTTGDVDERFTLAQVAQTVLSSRRERLVADRTYHVAVPNVAVTTNAVSRDALVRSVAPITGNSYCEFAGIDFASPAFNMGFGIATLNGCSPGNWLGRNSTSAGFWDGGPTVFINHFGAGGATDADIGIQFGNTDIVSMAVNPTAELLWFRVNGGLWNGDPSADPATGIGGLSFSTLDPGPYYVWIDSEFPGNVQQVNFGATPYAFPPPVGFGNVGGGTPTTLDPSSAFTMNLLPNGSDSNNGLITGSAFASIQHAMDVIADTLDVAGFDIGITAAGGIYYLNMRPAIDIGGLSLVGAGSADTFIVLSSSDFINYDFTSSSATVYDFTERLTAPRTYYVQAQNVLLNTDNTVTSGGHDQGARSAASASSGKFFNSFSIANNLNPNQEWMAVGVGTSIAVLFTTTTRWLGNPILQGIGFWSGNGGVYLGGVQIATIAPYFPGDIVDQAVDIDAKLAWWRVNGGLWNDDPSADPFTGVGGISWAAVADGPYYVWIDLEQQNIVGQANFGATPYPFAPPVGYGNWEVGGQPTTWDSSNPPNSIGAKTTLIGGGSNANNGLTAASPWATIQHAMDFVTGLDADAYGITLSLGIGVYNPLQLNLIVGCPTLTFVGGGSSAAETVIGGLTTLSQNYQLAFSDVVLATGGATQVLVFPSRGVAQSALIPAAVSTIETLGFASAGDGGDGVYSPASGSTLGGFQTADLKWWQLNVTSPVNGMAFGPKPSNNSADADVNIAAIQAALDYAFAHGENHVNLRGGRYFISDSVFVDPPGNLRANPSNPTIFGWSLSLNGDGGQDTGTVLLTTFTDRPAVWIGTGQVCGCDRITAQGPANRHPKLFNSNFTGFAIAGGNAGATRTVSESCTARNFYTGITIDQNTESFGEVNNILNPLIYNCYIGIRTFGPNAVVTYVRNPSIYASQCIIADEEVQAESGEYFGIQQPTLECQRTTYSGATNLVRNGGGSSYTLTCVIDSPTDAWANLIYTHATVVLPHFGVVSFTIDAFDSNTNTATLTTEGGWTFQHFPNYQFGEFLDTGTDFNAEFQANTVIYAREHWFVFQGHVRARNWRIEMDTAHTIYSGSVSGFRTASMTDGFFNGFLKTNYNDSTVNVYAHFLGAISYPYVYYGTGLVEFKRNMLAPFNAIDPHGASSIVLWCGSPLPAQGNKLEWEDNYVGSPGTVNLWPSPVFDHSEARYDAPSPNPAQRDGPNIYADSALLRPFIGGEVGAIEQWYIRNTGTEKTKYLGWWPEDSETPRKTPIEVDAVANATSLATAQYVTNDGSLTVQPCWHHKLYSVSAPGAVGYSHVRNAASAATVQDANARIGFTYGFDLSVNWSAQAGACFVQLTGGDLHSSWLFAGMYIGIDLGNGQGVQDCIITATYWDMGYITVRLNQHRVYHLKPQGGDVTTVYTGSTLKQYPFQIAKLGRQAEFVNSLLSELATGRAFNQGDVVWRFSVTTGTSPGWVCTTAGSVGAGVGFSPLANLGVEVFP